MKYVGRTMAATDVEFVEIVIDEKGEIARGQNQHIKLPGMITKDMASNEIRKILGKEVTFLIVGVQSEIKKYRMPMEMFINNAEEVSVIESDLKH